MFDRKITHGTVEPSASDVPRVGATRDVWRKTAAKLLSCEKVRPKVTPDLQICYPTLLRGFVGRASARSSAQHESSSLISSHISGRLNLLGAERLPGLVAPRQFRHRVGVDDEVVAAGKDLVSKFAFGCVVEFAFGCVVLCVWPWWSTSRGVVPRGSLVTRPTKP
jgi:hypothetical protein